MSKRMIAQHVGASGHIGSAIDKLTDRELEVLQLIGEGKEVREIADQLHLSAKTVEAHRAHIKEKLNMNNAREVARFAVQWVDRQR
jgi:DNA-binding NarL/FixJ family response regulator